MLTLLLSTATVIGLAWGTYNLMDLVGYVVTWRLRRRLAGRN